MPDQKIDRFLHQTVPPLADYVYNLHFSSSGAKTVTVPSDNDLYTVLFATTVLPFYVAYSGTAAVPTGDVTDGTGVSVSPTMRKVRSGQTFSVYAPTAMEMSLEFFRVG